MPATNGDIADPPTINRALAEAACALQKAEEAASSPDVARLHVECASSWLGMAGILAGIGAIR